MIASYDLWLVGISCLIAAMAAYTSLSLADRVTAASSRRAMLGWLAGGALSMGAGVWAMHFIGMLAFSLSVPVRYDVLITLFSMVPAILASIVMIWIVSRVSVRRTHLIAGGTLMGAGIGTMHFLGMAAMQLDARMMYAPSLFLVSILVAVALAVVALSARRWIDHFGLFANLRNLVAAPIMGLAIALMHYTAMSSTYFFPMSSQTITESMDSAFLAIAIGTVIAVLLALTLIAVRVDYHLGQASQKIQQGKIRFKAVVDSVADGIITIDRTGAILDINPGGLQMFGYLRDEILGQSVNTFMRDSDADKHQIRIDGYSGKFKSGERIMQREVFGCRKNGETFPVDISVTEMVINDEIMFVGVCRDVTERKKAQKVLEAKSQELERSNKNLIVARQMADESNQAKSEFLSRMSHELRTPMNSIIGFTGIVRDGAAGPVTDEQKKQLGMVYKSARHLLGLINDVLDISRIEAGKMFVTKDSFELVALLEEVLGLMQTQAEAKGISLIADFSDAPEYLHSDGDKLRQILLNLLGNAIKFTDTGSVTLRCRQKGDMIELAVIDTGIGIKPDDQKAIFEAFRQVDGGDERQQEGSGLGLAISTQFTELLGGKLGVSSAPGAGSTFSLQLPFSPAVVEAGKAGKPPARSTSRGSVPLRTAETRADNSNRTVLVVDDQPEALVLMEKYLENEGYNVLLCDNGEDAVQLAERHTPFAITLDLLMPDPDGWATLSALKARSETADIPVILISSMDEPELGLSLGAVNYMQKPVEATDLAQCLNDLQLSGTSILVVDDREQDGEMLRVMLEIDEYKVTVCQGGAEALSLIEDRQFDLILLDLMMPGMSGFEFIRRLGGLADQAKREIPIIVVSAKTLTKAESAYLKNNVENILVKGQFDRVEMMSEVGEALDRLAVEATETLEIQCTGS
jgi:PAS domain S-box-containing protein